MRMIKNIVGYTLGIMAALMISTCAMKSCGDAIAGDFSMDTEISVGYKDMLSGHSESQERGDEASTRCMNGGFGVDLEYKIPLFYNFNKYFGVSFVPGTGVTYSNFETAYREGVSQPESKQKRESSIRSMVTFRPTVRLWKVRLFKTYGWGLDYNEPTSSFGLGYIRPDDSRGIGIDFTNTFSANAEEYKFVRYDGTTYRYQTFTFNYTF